jgi:hypothetical protein
MTEASRGTAASLEAGWAELAEGSWDAARASFEAAAAAEETPEAFEGLSWAAFHVRTLFGDRVEGLELARRTYTESAPSPGDYRDFFKATFGPVVAIYADLEGKPDRSAALDRDFLDFATRANEGARGGPAEYRYEYLLVVARTRRG